MTDVISKQESHTYHAALQGRHAVHIASEHILRVIANLRAIVADLSSISYCIF